MAADLVLIDLDDLSYVPLNSVARQLVFSECGRGVETTIVGGRIVMRDGRMATIDERALRAEIAELMPAFLRDVAQVRAAGLQAHPYLLQANRNVGREDVGLHRYVGRRTE